MSLEITPSLAAGALSLIGVGVTGWFGWKQAIRVGVQQADTARRTAEAGIDLKRIEVGGEAAARADEYLEKSRAEVVGLLKQLDAERKVHGDEMLITKVALALAQAVEERLKLEAARRDGQALGSGVAFSRSPALPAPEMPEGAPRPRVLIVDDVANTVEYFREVLENEGYHIQSAPNARDGLQQAMGAPFEVIILDYRMPGMDGMEAARRLRRAEREAGRSECGILFCTGESDVFRGAMMSEFGRAVCLGKPVPPLALCAAVKALIEEKRVVGT